MAPEKLGDGDSNNCSLVDHNEDLIQRDMERVEIISPGKISDILFVNDLNDVNKKCKSNEPVLDSTDSVQKAHKILEEHLTLSLVVRNVGWNR